MTETSSTPSGTTKFVQFPSNKVFGNLQTTNNKEIYFIRHGQTDWNILGKAQGCENDIPLNNNGRNQAKKTGEYLAKHRILDHPFDLIISSGMSRANETAQIIANKLAYDKEIHIIDDFKEKCHGDIGGKTDEEIKLDKKFKKFIERTDLFENEIDPIKQREIYYENNIIFNKLYGTELFSSLKKRIRNALNELYKRPEQKIIVVSHGGTIHTMIEILTNIEDYIIGNYKYGANCHITYLKVYEKIKQNKIKRKIKIIKLMNTLHLK